MGKEETRSCKTYKSAPSCSTIRVAVDYHIGENLIGVSRAPIKKPHPTPVRRAFYIRMKKNNGRVAHGRHFMDYAVTAMEQMELYCAAHPGSPSATRRPRLSVRGELWIALLGPTVEEGIVGIGSTVTAALRAFDAQYLAGLRPPVEVVGDRRAVRRASSASAA